MNDLLVRWIYPATVIATVLEELAGVVVVVVELAGVVVEVVEVLVPLTI